MNKIFNVSNLEVSTINLWKIDDQTFRLIQQGTLQLLLIGSDYTLIEKSLIRVFDHLLKDEIEIKKVKIIRKATGEEWNNYYELNIKEHIDPEKIKIVDPNERSVWQYQHHLFVSETLKNELKKVAGKKLSFSIGFSHFG